MVMVSAFDVSPFTGCHNGRRVYSNAVAATILRRRYPLGLRRGMQRPSVRVVAAERKLPITFTNHISRCLPYPRKSAVRLSYLCAFASLREIFLLSLRALLSFAAIYS